MATSALGILGFGDIEDVKSLVSVAGDWGFGDTAFETVLVLTACTLARLTPLVAPVIR